jgi:hypothetical protein
MRDEEKLAVTSGRAGMRRLAAAGAVLCALTLTAAAPAPAPVPQKQLAALQRLEPGLWQLRDLDDRSAAPRTLCIGDRLRILQIQHAGDRCTRVVHRDRPNEAIITYSCPGSGSGRTWMRVETSRLAQLETQGVRNGAPFAYRLEARHAGSCGGGGLAR